MDRFPGPTRPSPRQVAQAARGCVFAGARPEDKLRIVKAAGAVSWLVGHAVLGILMGWERQPVDVPALLRNWPMLAWAAGAAVFALALVAIPPFASLLHAGRVPLPAALLGCGAAVAAPLWLEVAKRVKHA